MWNELVTTALIGTERRQLSLENPPDGLRELTAQLTDQPAERQLLALAGAAALYRRAGQTALIADTPLLDPCDRDDLPPCSPRAGLLLQQMFAMGIYTPYLTEWMQAAAHAGQRISDEYLARSLIQFEGRQNMVGMLYDVLGQRGRWLAHQNPAWAYAVLPESDAEWEVASFPARIEYLRKLRASDPSHGRALLESVWQSEKAEDRALFLKTFEAGLSFEDEPFLEAALDDRSSKVNLHAGLLLRNLTGSAYQQRMITRADSFIEIEWQKQPVGKKLMIDVTLPETCDKALIRDGIDPKSVTDDRFSPRALCLLMIAATLPSSHWLRGDWSARDLAQAAVDHGDWSELLCTALTQITRNHPADELAEAILELNKDKEVFPDNTYLLHALLAITPAARESYALQALAADVSSPSDESRAFKILRTLHFIDHPWSSGLTLAFIKATAEILPKQSGANVITLASYLTQYVTGMHPAYHDELAALANVDNKSKPTWSSAVKRAAQTLEFRQKIQKEFAR